MSLPKKNKTLININPPKIGIEYLKYGMDRIEELMIETDIKTKFLPRTISLDDLDLTLFEYVNDDKMKLILDGASVPVFYLDSDRWGELSKTWKFYDGDKNVPTPYLTIRRINKAAGTRIGNKYKVPQSKRFRYLEIPILDENEVVYLTFKLPEPTNVDLTYEVVLFSKYRVDVNVFDEMVLKNFASRQDYVYVKGNPMPIIFEGFAESNPIENVDGDRLFTSKYAIKLMGFIQNEEEFEITKTSRKPTFNYNVS